MNLPAEGCTPQPVRPATPLYTDNRTPLDAVTTLKERLGADILMYGYGPVAKSLLKVGLLDELILWVHPVLAGVGRAEDLLLEQGLNAELTLLT